MTACSSVGQERWCSWVVSLDARPFKVHVLALGPSVGPSLALAWSVSCFAVLALSLVLALWWTNQEVVRILNPSLAAMRSVAL